MNGDTKNLMTKREEMGSENTNSSDLKQLNNDMSKGGVIKEQGEQTKKFSEKTNN